jgi:nucleoside-diphosphate-sugar epimerase
LLAATAAADAASGYPLNVGAGERTSINELLELIEQVTGRSIRREHRPSRAGDVRDSLASLQRATDRIGYLPDVRLLDGLRRTWEWFAKREPTLTGASATPRR